jgi:fimbrial chaperone protein
MKLIRAWVKAGFVAVPIIFFSSQLLAANFSIDPTMLELNASVKSGVFTVINSDTEKLNVQVEVKEWTQDADGKDVYNDTKEIIFFPKIMTVEPNEQRAIRIGITVPASNKEKTYRLFVEEIPSPKREEGKDSSAKRISAGLTIAFRYATPIFVVPPRPQVSAVVEKVDLTKGIARATVRNAGNVRVKLLSVVFRGKTSNGRELFTKEIAGWYILQGVSGRYETAIPKEVCSELATIEVVGRAENLTVNGTLNADRKMCSE